MAAVQEGAPSAVFLHSEVLKTNHLWRRWTSKETLDPSRAALSVRCVLK
jgi:hypothetical protein